MNLVQPIVSWVLPTNQNNQLLHRAIASCLNQTEQRFELLIIVNGIKSDVISKELVEHYINEKRIRVINTQVHLINFSLSLGLHLSKSDFIARMDADDVSHPERLSKQLSFMYKNTDIGIVGTFYNLINSAGSIVKEIRLPQSDFEIRKSLIFRNPICHPSVLFRKNLIMSAGGYLGGKHAEDYDLWVRLARNKSMRFANLPEYLLSYNSDFSGDSRRSKEAYVNMASCQSREFLLTGNFRWLFAAALSSVKSVICKKTL